MATVPMYEKKKKDHCVVRHMPCKEKTVEPSLGLCESIKKYCE